MLGTDKAGHEGVAGHPQGHSVGKGPFSPGRVSALKRLQVRPWKSRPALAGEHANVAETAEKGVPLALPRQAHGLGSSGPQPKGTTCFWHLEQASDQRPRTASKNSCHPAGVWKTRLFPDLGSCREGKRVGKKEKRPD